MKNLFGTNLVKTFKIASILLITHLLIAHFSNAYAKTEPKNSEIPPVDEMNHYIVCYNKVNDRVMKSIERYASWVKDLDQGPTGNETIVYGTYGIRETIFEDCSAYPTVIKTDKFPIQQQYIEFITALKPLVKSINEVDDYYSRESYKDDKFTKGKLLHVELMKNINFFNAIYSQFSYELEKAEDLMTLTQIQSLEGNPETEVQYLIAISMYTSKEIIDKITEDSFDLATVETELNQLDGFYKQFVEKNLDQDIKLNWFVKSLDQFSRVARDRFRRIRDNDMYSDAEKSLLGGQGAWMVEGSAEKALDQYNKLVDTLNDLN